MGKKHPPDHTLKTTGGDINTRSTISYTVWEPHVGYIQSHFQQLFPTIRDTHLYPKWTYTGPTTLSNHPPTDQFHPGQNTIATLCIRKIPIGQARVD